jgi:hypothetical protein
MMTRPDNKPSLRREPKYIFPAWTVSQYGDDCGTVIRTKDGWAASRNTWQVTRYLGVFTTKLSAMHAVLGRGIKS